jgi:signal transduction histidine kinase/CheY-like chemotaxis protein
LILFRNINLTAQLYLAFGLLFALIVLTGGSGYYFSNKLGQSTKILSRTASPLVDQTFFLVESALKMNLRLQAESNQLDIGAIHRISVQLADFDQASRTGLRNLVRLAKQADFPLDVSDAASYTAKFGKQAQDMLTARREQLDQAMEAKRQLEIFEAQRSKLLTLLAVLSRESEAKMSAREDSSKTLVQSGLASVKQLGESLDITFNETYPLVQGTYRLMRYLEQFHNITRAFLVEQEATQLDDLGAEFESITHKSASRIRRIKGRAHSPKDRAMIKDVAIGFGKLKSIVLAQDGLFTAHRQALKSNKTALGLEVMLSASSTHYQLALQRVVALAGRIKTQASEATIRDTEKAIYGIAGTIVLGMLTALFCGFLLTREIIRPMIRITGSMRGLAAGDNNIRIQHTEDGNEIGDLARALMVFKENAIERDQNELERIELENKLRQSQKMEAVGQLTGGIAHEFNNLLMVIVGNLERTAKQVADHNAQMFLSSAMSSAMRGAELTRQLLTFSRKQDLKTEPIDMNALVGVLRNMLQRALGETVSVIFKPVDGTWLVLADRSLMESTLLNLSLNARDAMPNGGNITISVSNRVVVPELTSKHADAAPGDYVMLEVSDTGSGITPKDLEHVFEPFFTTKDVGEGTGLGLSMILGFAEQSGGFVDIESQLDRGTKVRVYLPRTMEAAIASEPGKTTDAHVPSMNATVLVVEDDPDVREIVVGIISELGCTVIEAEDGKAALRYLDDRQDIDVMFTDVVLPGGLSGPDIVNKARIRIPDLKVILTSGYPDGENNDWTNDEHPWFLRKPYRRTELAELFKKVLQT